MAYNDKGVRQNEKEVEVYTSPKYKKFTTKIYDFNNKNYYWIISEIVRPLKNKKEFKDLTGFFFDDLEILLLSAAIYDIEQIEYLMDSISEIDAEGDSLFADAVYASLRIPQEKIKWINDLMLFLKENKIAPEDIASIEHWGKTSEGNAIILDYGL